MPPGVVSQRIARNALLKGVAEVTSRLLTVLFLMMAARLLAPEGFGKFTFAASLTALFAIGLDLGLLPVFVREVARDRASFFRQWGAVLSLKGILAGPVLLLLGLLPLWMGRPWDTVWAVWCMAAFVAVNSGVELIVSAFEAMEEMEYELAIRLIQKMGLLILGAGALLLGGRLLAVTGAYLLSAILAVGAGLVLLRRRLGGLRWGWDREVVGALLRETWPLALASLAIFAYGRIAPVILAIFRDDQEVGLFGAAWRLIETLGFVPAVFVIAVFPTLAASYARHEERFARGFAKTLQFLLVLGLPLAVGTALLAPKIIRFFYGPAFLPAAPALAVLIWSTVFSFLNFLFAYLLVSVNRQRVSSAIATAALGLGVGLHLLLVPRWGYLGSSWAVVVTEAAFSIMAWIALRRLFHLSAPLPTLLKVVVSAAAMGALLELFPGGPLMAQVLLGAGVYAGCLVLLRGLSREDYLLFAQLLSRRGAA